MTLALCLHNALWYYALYGLVSFLVMRFASLQNRKKVLTYASPGSARDRMFLCLSRIFRILSFVIAFFAPIDLLSWNFITGFLIYFTGLALGAAALWQFSHADGSQPVTEGLYRVSRHPMQVSFYVLCIGVLLMGANLYLSLSVVCYMAASYPSLRLQETYCLTKYGAAYQTYLNHTPRIFLWKQEKEMHHD